MMSKRVNMVKFCMKFTVALHPFPAAFKGDTFFIEARRTIVGGERGSGRPSATGRLDAASGARLVREHIPDDARKRATGTRSSAVAVGRKSDRRRRRWREYR